MPGKPLNPIDLSTHVSHKAHEGGVTEPPRSPYAPERAHQRAGTERHPVENDRDPLQSPYAPKQPRAQPAVVTSAFAAGDDAGPLPPVRAPGGLREHTERPAVGADEPHLRSHDAVHPNIGRQEKGAAARRDEIMSDHDFEQLEASLRRLQRQQTRPPRATNLAPVPGLAPVHANRRRHSGDRAGNGFQSARSLEPERLPPPPAMSRRNILAPLGIVVASVLLATIAYYFVVGWATSSEPAPGPQTASSERLPPDETSQPDVAMLQPGEPGAQVPSATKASRMLDPQEIKLLMKQGEQFIAAGDVVTARIVFQRAAEAGDANAAIALGATYDPTVLAKLGVAGLGSNVEKARTWYQKAESLGSMEATRRLAILANR
jgi:hypothetical protein